VTAQAKPGCLVRPLGELLDAFGPGNEWTPLLQAWRDSPAGRRLIDAVDARVAAGGTVYPAEVFRALASTSLSRVRVLILGQDPYHGPGQAEGLAFSVAPGQRWPPSLRNILAEWQRDLGLPLPVHGSLLPWTRQGVLLLNTALTVEEGRPASHAKLGWEVLTDEIISAVASDAAPKVFMLWGVHSQAKVARIEAAGRGHLVLQCNHPSPLSARRPPVPFIGCGHFSRANAWLAAADPRAGGLDWGLADSA